MHHISCFWWSTVNGLVLKCILPSLLDKIALIHYVMPEQIALKETSVLELIDSEEHFLRTKLEIITLSN